MAWIDHARAELAGAGHRAGGARAAVLDLLAAQDCCLSAQEIFDRLRESDRSVGLASVYRTLDLLTGMHLVHRVDVGGVACYEPAAPGGEHHHHAICDGCGAVSAFEDPGLERAIHELAERIRYRVDAHDVVLRGLCPSCS